MRKRTQGECKNQQARSSSLEATYLLKSLGHEFPAIGAFHVEDACPWVPYELALFLLDLGLIRGLGRRSKDHTHTQEQ